MSLADKAVIFDLDGTVLNTIGDIAAALNRTLSLNGYPTHSVEKVKGFIGNGSFMLMRRALPETVSDSAVSILRAKYCAEYDSDMVSRTVIYDGIGELFDELCRRQIKTAVITNKDDKNAVPIINRFLGGRVNICRGVRVDSERKPSPQLTLSVLSELGVKPENAIFTGDGLADYETAKNCGIRFIPVGYGYTASETLFAACGKKPVADAYELRQEIFKYL